MVAEVAAVTRVEYRDIPGFPGYRIGSDGSVWSSKTTHIGAPSKPFRAMKTDHATNYPTVKLSRNGAQFSRKVHVLVLEIFVGPRPKGMVAAHRNGIANDCRLQNLRWATQQENELDKVAHGRIPRGVDVFASRTNEQSVREMRLLFGTMANTAIAKRFGISESSVRRIRDRKTWGWV